MLTGWTIPSIAGINGVAWDAVELPSQFMENFAWRPEVLAAMARHFETGEPLPADKLARCCARARFQAGLATVRQLEFALFDFRLHAEYTTRAGRARRTRSSPRCGARSPWCGRRDGTASRTTSRTSSPAATPRATTATSGPRCSPPTRSPPSRNRACSIATRRERFLDAILRGRRQPQRARRVRRVPRPRRRSSSALLRQSGIALPTSARSEGRDLERQQPARCVWNTCSRGCDREQPDVLALQETRAEDEDFPADALRARGYSVDVQRPGGYNGVAIVSRITCRPVAHGIGGGYVDDAEARARRDVRAASGSTSLYVPNGESAESDKYRYKLGWLAALRNYSAVELTRYPQLARRGRLQRRARRSRRLRSGRMGRSGALHSGRARGARIDRGAWPARHVSSLRSATGKYSWWDYRAGMFRRNEDCGSTSCSRRVLKSNVSRMPDRSGAARLGAAVRPCAGRRRIRAA